MQTRKSTRRRICELALPTDILVGVFGLLPLRTHWTKIQRVSTQWRIASNAALSNHPTIFCFESPLKPPHNMQCFKLCLSPTVRWMSVQLPTPSEGGWRHAGGIDGAVAIDDKVWISGSVLNGTECGGDFQTVLEEFCPRTNTWTQSGEEAGNCEDYPGGGNDAEFNMRG